MRSAAAVAVPVPEAVDGLSHDELDLVNREELAGAEIAAVGAHCVEIFQAQAYRFAGVQLEDVSNQGAMLLEYGLHLGFSKLLLKRVQACLGGVEANVVVHEVLDRISNVFSPNKHKFGVRNSHQPLNPLPEQNRPLPVVHSHPVLVQALIVNERRVVLPRRRDLQRVVPAPSEEGAKGLGWVGLVVARIFFSASSRLARSISLAHLLIL